MIKTLIKLFSKKVESKFVPFKEVIAAFVDSKNNSSCYDQYYFTYEQDYQRARMNQHLVHNPPELINKKIYKLLKLIEDGHLILYGRKLISLELCELEPIDKTSICVISPFYKVNWSENFDTVFTNYKNEVTLAYLNVSMSIEDYKKMLKQLGLKI